MSAADVIAWENRRRAVAAAAAVIGGILPLVGSALAIAALRDAPHNLPGFLFYLSGHSGSLYAASVFVGLGAVGMTVALLYLWRAVTAREEEGGRRMPRAMPYLIVLAGVLYGATGASVSGNFALFGAVTQPIAASKIAHFATHGAQTWQQANDLQTSGIFEAAFVLELLCSLALLCTLILLSLAAIRTGLVTRFLGYIGILVGVLLLLPLVPLPIVQAFWLVALGALIAGKWPNGVPEAWRSGTAVPWPARQPPRERPARPARRGGLFSRPAPEAEPEPVPTPAPAAPADPGAARRKRKRKR